MKKNIKVIIFDWGDTIMRDFPDQPGPMAEWAHVELIPSVKETLQGLSKKYTCVIATNAGASDTTLMRKALARVACEDYFQYFFSSKDLGIEKPHPDFFKKIALTLKASPHECIHVGNLYAKDIVGAKAAGMHTIFFNEKKISGAFPDADRVIYHMETLSEQIQSLSDVCQ